VTTKSLRLPWQKGKNQGVQFARPDSNMRIRDLFPLLPFLLFVLFFLLLPASALIIGAFEEQGQFTLQHITDLSQRFILEAYRNSIQVSLVTALVGGVFGFLLAYAITLGNLPPSIRVLVTTFAGVASNFAGVPLAFAFISTLGRTGMITGLFKSAGINLYQEGFDLYTFTGLSLTYLYFQFPLMILIMAPALDGLRREWREASENLGATGIQYWRYVAFPILLPSILGTMVLLFGNAFGAYATAFALTGGTLDLVTIMIGAQIRGNVLYDPGLGYAMAVGMIVIMAFSIAVYSWLQRRSERWLR
jgi:putative spermidine/putrescine transport system permease protein